ncbi:hypothetical protein DID88_000291 [Monilinia fructigena]|uniref:Uncharacterized protein n=1 Tax=Monilinia fructigena TaxID=38457 RepID=A0A395IJK3_9HELO|nr:hypothetical protein DID88_000291 [Monilinia fructigena]
MSKQKLVQPTKVSDAMGANQLPINKNERLWTSPHNWDSSDTISPQFSTRNHLNTKKIQTNSTSEEYLGFLSDETQLMMNEARQKALSVRGMVMETRGKKQAGVFSNNMISSEHTQAQEMSIHNWLMIADARIKKLSSRDLLVASSGQEKENKTAASFDGTTTEFLRAPENANENPLIYDSEDDRPMGHLFERRTSSRRNFRPKKYIQTRAEKIDKIAVQGLERWGYSKAITPSAGNSELSNVTYSTVTREDKYPDSHKKLHKFTDAEVNTAKQPIVQGSSVITVPTQADTKFPHDKIAVFARAHNEDKPISEDSPAIIAPAQEYSQIKQMVNESPESYDQTQGTGQKSPIKSSMRKPSGTSKARLPKGAHDCEPEDILEDNLLKKVEDTNSDTKVEDGWVMADDEAEEWEIL